ncbi:RNA recognition domain-containing protein [Rutstroemia sp. NJR-2017a BBW]|nr:RNA recognition domain-containing protein [Rutstroemia sp. NJR-2017a BBW]
MPRSPTPPPARGRARTRSRSRTPYSEYTRRSISPRSRSRSRSRSVTRSPVGRGRYRERSLTPRRSRSRSRSESRGGRGRGRSGSRGRGAGGEELGSTKVVIEKLTKNVTEDHLREIFGTYGEIRDLDMPMNRHFNTNRGTAYILYVTATSANQRLDRAPATEILPRSTDGPARREYRSPGAVSRG